ncbi:MAG: phosphomannomutase [Vulcanimicrobiota bacterium]
MKPACFKTYDIRGRVPSEFNQPLAQRVGRAFARLLSPTQVAVGWDARLSSPELAEAVTAGLRSQGVNVLKLGLCGTETVYFAVHSLSLGGGVMVTASHNPADYNGLKFVGPRAVPLSNQQFEQLAAATRQEWPDTNRGGVEERDITDAFLDRLVELFAPASLGAWRIVADAGNGAIGPTLCHLAKRYPDLELLVLHGQPDGTFPNGVPNPLLPENRAATAAAVREHQAELGVAWDGDFDRCFLFDHRGEFVDNYYLLAALAGHYLEREPGGIIVHDPRLTWHTIEAVTRLGGTPRLSRTGHAFVKAAMRESEAIYGAEMSGHHYFRDFGYCDSGLLPFLATLQMLHRRGRSLADLLDGGRARFPISGEINREVADSEAVLAAAATEFGPQALRRCDLDGLSLDFADWRFNLRRSNTEPLIRLNVESRGDADLVERMTQRLLALVEGVGKNKPQRL